MVIRIRRGKTSSYCTWGEQLVVIFYIAIVMESELVISCCYVSVAWNPIRSGEIFGLVVMSVVGRKEKKKKNSSISI
jgi:hypothetical protein